MGNGRVLRGVNTPLKPELLLQAYAAGVFPMAESRDDPDVFWVDPRHRGILPLDGFHVSRSLARTMAARPSGSASTAPSRR
jgi:leucyl/phenylalanyl-tRNA---protein transferase